MSKNFKYLDNLIHTGIKEIVLDSNIVLDEGEESNYKDGIKLDVDGLVIEGNGHTIDAKGKTRIFYCTGKNITIKNITLKNGFTKNDGGAINNNEELTIKKSILIKNMAQNDGGAITNKGKLTIAESMLNENVTQKHGGAINNNGELTFEKSSFNKNISKKGNGGAITNKNSGSLSLNDSTLNENIVQKGNGGAITNWGKLSITESKLIKNITQNYGGAINNYGELAIKESLLNENTANTGGAINNKNGSFKIFDCEFSNNNSPMNIIYNSDSLQIFNSTIISNHSDNIIVNGDDQSNLNIFNGIFKENDVLKSIIFNNGKSCTIERSIFENNIFHVNSHNIINKSDLKLIYPKMKDECGTIFNEGHILINQSSSDFLSKIQGNGMVESKSDIIIPKNEQFDFGYLNKIIRECSGKEIILKEDISLKTYERDFYEGGIELDIDDLIIDGNGKTIDGDDKSRIFLVTGNNITLKNITFKNGRSHKNYDNPLNNHGGAIKINHELNLTIENCKFIANTSEKNGGAIYNNGKLIIKQSILNENTSKKGSGGAITNKNNGTLTIIKSTLDENTADIGGAINNNDSKLTIIESALNKNIVQKHGGAITNKNNSISAITTSRFNGNVAKKSGGAITSHNAGLLIIIKSTLDENTAKYDGGAVTNHTGATLVIIESALNKNIVQKRGGAITNKNNGTLTIIKSTLDENAADIGGAINNNDSKLTLFESEINENSAQNRGGAILSRNKGKIKINDCILKNNKPDDVYEEKD